MKASSGKNRTIRLIISAVMIALIVSLMVSYVSDLMTISAKKQELAAVTAQLDQQKADNAELERTLEGDDEEILERVARDTYGYAAPNERVFQDITGQS